MGDQVPIHLDEIKVFRKYEKHLFRIVSEYPKRVTFDPTPFSQQTLIGRLRDAMASHIVYKWKSVVDPTKLQEIRSKIKVCPEDGMVVVRSRDEVGAAGEIMEPQFVETPIGPAKYKVESPTQVDLHAFAHLLGRGHITGPVIFSKCDSTLFNEILQTYNVAVKQENDLFIML